MFRHAHGGALPGLERRGERRGRLAYEQLQSLPIQWVDQTELLLHKDPEFEAITQLDQSWLA